MGKSGKTDVTVFRGSFEHTIDEKGRVSIPAKFREIVLGMQDDRLVVTKFILNSHRCLDVYPQAEWERFEQELTKKPRFDEDFLKMENFYLSNAHECLVMFTSALGKFRIWDKETWQRYEEESERDLAQNPRLFNSLNV